MSLCSASMYRSTLKGVCVKSLHYPLFIEVRVVSVHAFHMSISDPHVPMSVDSSILHLHI